MDINKYPSFDECWGGMSFLDSSDENDSQAPRKRHKIADE